MRLRIFALVASAGRLPTHPCGRDRVDSYTLLAYHDSYTLMAYKSPYGVHRSTGLTRHLSDYLSDGEHRAVQEELGTNPELEI